MKIIKNLFDIIYKGSKARQETMIQFEFNEKKTTQMAVFFIKKNGNVLNYTKLIKLLYLADREALNLWNRSLTGDNYSSLPHGPVLSLTYDLIDYPLGTFWHNHIKKGDYHVYLIDDLNTDELSKKEMDLIAEIHNKYKDKDWKEMIDICHKICKEWEDHHGSSRPITVNKMLEVLGKDAKVIKGIEEETDNFNHAKKLFSSTN